MVDEEKTTYPNMPVGQWWEIRKKFKQSLPAQVNARYCATALGMQESSANANIIPNLIRFGIIDAEGKPTDRANRWRDDGEYPKVCAEIMKEIYPQELFDAVPDPKSNPDLAKNWFLLKTKTGNDASRKMAATYKLLYEADPNAMPEKKETGPKPPAPVRQAKIEKEKPELKQAVSIPEGTLSRGPSIHIDIQIHISPDTKPEQIDYIFASMAKHLYKGEINETKTGDT